MKFATYRHDDRTCYGAVVDGGIVDLSRRFWGRLATLRDALEAGADLLFVDAPSTVVHMHAIIASFKGKVPLLINMVEGGKSPVKTAS